MNSTSRTFLYGGDPLLDPGHEGAGTDVAGGDDERLGRLAALRVRHADHRDVEDVWVGQQHGLQFGGRHTVAVDASAVAAARQRLTPRSGSPAPTLRREGHHLR